MIRRDASLVLNLGLELVYLVVGIEFQRDVLAGRSLHKDLYTPAEAKHEVQGAIFVDIVFRKAAVVVAEKPKRLVHTAEASLSSFDRI